MSEYVLTSDGELRHYGVKGMKWGVRRDARILVNNRRNRTIRKIREDYKSGKINADERKALRKAANAKKKQDLKDIKDAYEKGSAKDRDRIERDIVRKTSTQVDRAGLKRAASDVNAVFGGWNIANVGLAGVGLALSNPAFAGAAVASVAVSTAAELGYRYAIQAGILDKLS